MSRTYRTNKLGEKRTDKFKKSWNGCGCGYCDYINTDFRRAHTDKFLDQEITENLNYMQDRYREYEHAIDDEDHYLDELSKNIIVENSIFIKKQ
jgi:hypothetical protein